MLANMFTTAAATKPWYLSKTLWFNTLTVIGTGLSMGLDWLCPYPWLVVGLLLAQGLVNIALRFTTKKAIK